jgi:hypothetical protein
MAKFEKGNPGRVPGTKNEKTKQWEALHESIVGKHAERFNTLLASWAESGDPELEEMFANNYVKLLEYFKPKLNRTTVVGEDGTPPVQLVIRGDLKI